MTAEHDRRLGLALSGGGFRAVLYHLGLVRFLRDAAILPQVTHISAVSGGSIFGAHLVLNWDRYNGSPNEFDAAGVRASLLSCVSMSAIGLSVAFLCACPCAGRAGFWDSRIAN